MIQLWNLLISAQENSSGIPQIFLDQKRQQIERQRTEKSQVVEKLEQRDNRRADSTNRRRSRLSKPLPKCHST